MDTETAGINNFRIAIASGKGGTGKTMVATNLFYALQSKSINTTLIDCDAEAPNDILFFENHGLECSKKVTQKVPVINEKKCTFCEKCHEYCNYNAIFILPNSKIIKVIDDLCHGCGACLYTCDDEAITEKDFHLGNVNFYALTKNTSIVEAKMNSGVYSPVNVIKAAIKEGGYNKFIIIDSPPGTSCPFIHSVSTADYVILVTEPTPFGLSDLIQSIETLKLMDLPYGVIINRAGIGDKKMHEYLKKENIKIIQEIPFDSEIASLYSNGKLLIDSNDKYSMIFKTIIEEIDIIAKAYSNNANTQN